MAELYGFTPNIGGIRAVLRSDEIQSELAALIAPITEAANANARERTAEYRAYVDVGNYTALGKVVCGNIAARYDNAHNNTLLRSMG